MDALGERALNEVQIETGQVGSVHEEAWLRGQPSLDSYIDYMKRTAIGGSDLQRALLADEWREANDYYYDLETTEAALADQIEIFDLPEVLSPLADEVRAASSFRRGFDVLPTSFAWVELKHLIAHQRHVNLTHVAHLRSRLSPVPTPEELFRFCLPLDRPDPKVHVRRASRDRFSLCSESLDFRFQEAVMLRPGQVVGHEVKGAVGGIIGLMVGFGSNFVCCIQSETRLILNNGYHRAYALLEHGVTHAPCIIETVTRLDELHMVAPQKVQDAPAFYFRAARPPLLKDFCDPKIRKVVRVPRVLHSIDVTIRVEEYRVIG